MAKNEAQKQKKLAKKRSKELARQRQAARQKNRMESFAGQFEAAQGGEILYAGLSPEFDAGTAIGSVVVIRRVDAARALMVRLLIDTALLGIKDVVTQSIPIGSLTNAREMFSQPGPGCMPSAPPEDIKKLIDMAIQFAADHGFQPSADYAKVAGFLDDVDPAKSRHSFEMGIDGKPTYVPGPFDSPTVISEMAERIDGRDEIMVDSEAIAAALLGGEFGGDDFSALDDPELDLDIDEDMDPDMVIDAESSRSNANS